MITSDELAVAAGILLSLLASYLPGFNTWYAGLTEDQKKLGMLIALVVVSGGALGLSCLPNFNLFGLSVTCDQAGLVSVIKALVLALIANQAVHRITPQATAVKEVKANQ